MNQTAFNPFIIGQPLQPEYFCGHNQALDTVLGRLGNPSKGSTSIIGSSYTGRSTFLRYLVSDIARESHLPLQSCWSVLYEAMPDEDLNPYRFWEEVFILAKEICEGDQVNEAIDRGLEKAQQENLLMPDIRKVVDRVGATGHTILLVIDDFDHLLKNPNFLPPVNNQFFEQFRHLCQRPRHGFAMVIATYRPLLDLWKFPHGSIFYNIFANAPLGHLDDVEVDELLSRMLAHTGITFSSQDKAEIRRRSKNLPVYIQYYAGLIYNGHVEGLDQNGRLQKIQQALAQPDNMHIQLDRYLINRMNPLERAAFNKALDSPGTLSENDHITLNTLNARGGLPPGVDY